MRFLRLSLRNFRGIAAREVEFLPTGITIIAGPNEIGKSSLAEAIDLLFNFPDSSKAVPVRAVQPVGRDEGTEITLDFEVGAHRLTYSKCFNRNTRTELTIQAPRSEMLTGRVAHDRVEQILDAAVDRSLWDALRIQQGASLDGPELDGSGSLAAALDRAAGQVGGGERESTLFDAAQAEFERYYTRSGRESTLLKGAADVVTQAAQEFNACEAELKKVETDVVESERLDREHARLDQSLGELRARAEASAAAVAALEKEEREVASLRNQVELLSVKRTQAEEKAAARRLLIERGERALAASARLHQQVEELSPELERRAEAERIAQAAVQEARSRWEEVRARVQLAEADFEYRDSERTYLQLKDQLERIREAEAARSTAEEELERNRVTGAALERIRTTHLGRERARAGVQAGSATLTIEALTTTELATPTGEEPLERGKRWSCDAIEPLEVRVGEVARIRLQPASSTLELAQALQAAEREYAEALEVAGVGDLAAAVAAAERHTAATHARRDATRKLKEVLVERTASQIEYQAERLHAKLERYPAERNATEPLPVDFEAAQDQRRAAITERDAAAETQATAERLHAPLLKALQESQQQISELGALARQQAELTAAEVQMLAAAREKAADELLDSELSEATAAFEGAQELHQQAALRLHSENPEEKRQVARIAALALSDTQRRLTEVRESKIQVRSRLEVAGDRGLDERLGEARAAHERAQTTYVALTRRAAAARLLFETLRNYREAAQRAYVQPLTERVERLGRLLYGKDFQVEIDSTLKVASRTLGGTTVPFNSLSGGAREQISLLMRLACAMLVSEGGGVPLIFDDALGNSDVTRLDEIGTLLTMAGDDCQVIVLTCAPDRYRSVGGARHLQLSPADPLLLAN